MTATSPSAAPIRRFGRFELRRLLGRSAGTMTWLALDPQSGDEVMLTMPRVQPADDAALVQWQREVRLGARLDHPQLAPVLEVGLQDHWPFVAVDRRHGMTIGEWLVDHPKPPPTEAVGWLVGLLRGLAFAHEAGALHRDLQLHQLLIDERGAVRLMALGAAGTAAPPAPGDAPEASGLQLQRSAALRDLTACGVLLHCLLTDHPVLDQPDVALVLDRMTPLGREVVRLPWTTPWPIPEALRAIANRCTAGQERLRYQSSRTLLGALTGWLEAQAGDGHGPLALLLDRLRTVGHLPALPGLARRIDRMTERDSRRTDEIADLVLDDLGLSFELLRTLNSAQVQGTQVQGNGAVLTLRRVVALIGIDGVRRAANALRLWPGPLAERQAAGLQRALERASHAGRIAQQLRPAGYDGQVVYLIAALQNLGRLLLRYHFADEAEQVEQLMKPARSPGTPDQPGLSEEAASWAVLGVDIESLGREAVRFWGLDDELVQMARRQAPDAPVHKPDSDTEVLRLLASAANDLVDVEHLHDGPKVGAERLKVVQRYARALALGNRDFLEAMQEARVAPPDPPDAPGGAGRPAARDETETGPLATLPVD